MGQGRFWSGSRLQNKKAAADPLRQRGRWLHLGYLIIKMKTITPMHSIATMTHRIV